MGQKPVAVFYFDRCFGGKHVRYTQTQLFEGQDIRFGPIDHEKDPEIEARWTHDSNFMRMMDTAPARPLSVALVKKQYEKLEKQMEEDKNFYYFAIRARDDDHLIGRAMIYWIEWSNGGGFIRLGIGAAEDRGRGYGTQALRMLLRFAFAELNLFRRGARCRPRTCGSSSTATPDRRATPSARRGGAAPRAPRRAHRRCRGPRSRSAPRRRATPSRPPRSARPGDELALEIAIRDNWIGGCHEDGIQLIDYTGLSDRRIRIERNILTGNAMAALGCMADGNRTENYAGSPMVEEAWIIGHTFSSSTHGLTGADNLLVM